VVVPYSVDGTVPSVFLSSGNQNFIGSSGIDKINLYCYLI